MEWRCFHCDDVFTDRAEAQEHFGLERDGSTPVCQLTAEDVRQLRALEQSNAELRAENERLENDSRLWHEAEADRQRRIGPREWWQELDYREGEKRVLQEEVKRLKAAMNTLGDELRMVSVRLCNATIGEGDLQRMLAAPPKPLPIEDRLLSVTRLEVIGKLRGRMLTLRPVEIELSFQDDNRTLKIFVGDQRLAG